LRSKKVSRITEAIFGKSFWTIGHGTWNTGNITEKLAEEYLKHYCNSSNIDYDSLIL